MNHVVRLETEDDWEGWRNAVRALVAEDIRPEEVSWQIGDGPGDLFGGRVVEPRMGPAFTVSKDFMALASRAILHRDPERFSLLHGLLLRVIENPAVLRDRSDPRTRRAEQFDQTIRRDMHKMRAFVRFRVLQDGDGARYVAWFEPEHHIVRANATFFVQRFSTMRWSILTPEIAIHWNGRILEEGPGATRQDAPGDDPVERVWKKYYISTFNPSRLKTKAMIKEMPIKYWKNLPEAQEISSLVTGARERELKMLDGARTAQDRRKGIATVTLLKTEAHDCRRCPLWQPATQTVFGEGDPNADIMFVGEPPGNEEDLAGQPFIGPAGAVFDRALVDAGLNRSEVYVTHAVKHVSFALRATSRVHVSPHATEIDACRWWLDQERALVRPRIIVAMGATAARSLTGKEIVIDETRGQVSLLADATPVLFTIHPGHVLRLQGGERAQSEYRHLVADMKAARTAVDAMAA